MCINKHIYYYTLIREHSFNTAIYNSRLSNVLFLEMRKDVCHARNLDSAVLTAGDYWTHSVSVYRLSLLYIEIQNTTDSRSYVKVSLGIPIFNNRYCFRVKLTDKLIIALWTFML